MSNQDKIATALIATVNNAADWLSELSDETIRYKPSLDRWSIAEVIGHLVDSACNNHRRFICCQLASARKVESYDQNTWVKAGGYCESDWNSLVSLWRLYNVHIAQVIRRIPTDKLDNLCDLGNGESCTLRYLATDYVDHMRHHLAKITERLESRI